MIAVAVTPRTRWTCVVGAACCEHWARVGEWGVSMMWLRNAVEWRALGKALPRRIGMCCARARRRQRRRNEPKARIKMRNLCTVFGAIATRAFLRAEHEIGAQLGEYTDPCAAGHDYQNADDYTGNVFCSRCGAQDCDAIC